MNVIDRVFVTTTDSRWNEFHYAPIFEQVVAGVGDMPALVITKHRGERVFSATHFATGLRIPYGFATAQAARTAALEWWERLSSDERFSFAHATDGNGSAMGVSPENQIIAGVIFRRYGGARMKT